MIIKIVVLSDMHVGSIYGICPTHHFNEHTNAYQLWAIDQWSNFLLNYRYPDYLILNGDIVDGAAKKDATVLCISDVNNQVDAAFDLLFSLLGSNTEIHGVTGSGYHFGKGSGFDGDRLVTEKLIEVSGLNGRHHRAEFGLSLSKYGMKNINFHHKGKNINTEARVAMKRAYATLAPRIDLIVSSHLHRKLEFNDGVCQIHTPCWQWETDFMSFVEPIDIGSTIIYVDIDQKTMRTEFYCPTRPRELFESMQHWEDLSPEREAELRAIARKKNDEEIDKLSKMFKRIPKNDLRKVVDVVKKDFKVPALPKTDFVKEVKAEKKEFKLPKNLPKPTVTK